MKKLSNVLDSIISALVKEQTVIDKFNLRVSPCSVASTIEEYCADVQYDGLIAYLYEENKRALGLCLPTEYIDRKKDSLTEQGKSALKHEVLSRLRKDLSLRTTPCFFSNEPKKTQTIRPKSSKPKALTKEDWATYIESIVSAYYEGQEEDLIDEDYARKKHPQAWPSISTMKQICEKQLDEIIRTGMQVCCIRESIRQKNVTVDDDYYPILRRSLSESMTKHIYAAKAMIDIFAFDWQWIEDKCRIYQRRDILAVVQRTKDEIQTVRSMYNYLEKKGCKEVALESCSTKPEKKMEQPSAEQKGLMNRSLAKEMLRISLGATRSTRPSALLEHTDNLVKLVQTTCVKVEEMLVLHELKIGTGYFLHFTPVAQMKVWRSIDRSVDYEEAMLESCSGKTDRRAKQSKVEQNVRSIKSPLHEFLENVSSEDRRVIQESARDNVKGIGLDKIAVSKELEKELVENKMNVAQKLDAIIEKKERAQQRTKDGIFAEKKKIFCEREKEITLLEGHVKLLKHCKKNLKPNKKSRVEEMNLRKVKSIISKMCGIMEQSDSMALFMKDSAKQKIEEAMVAQAVSTFLFSQDIYDQAVRFMQAYKKESPENASVIDYMMVAPGGLKILGEAELKGEIQKDIATKREDAVQIIDNVLDEKDHNLKKLKTTAKIEKLEETNRKLGSELQEAKKRKDAILEALVENQRIKKNKYKHAQLSDPKQLDRLTGPIFKSGALNIHQKEMAPISWMNGYKKTLEAISLIIDAELTPFAEKIEHHQALGQAIVHQLFSNIGANNACIYIGYDHAIMHIFIQIARKIKGGASSDQDLKDSANTLRENRDKVSLIGFLTNLGRVIDADDKSSREQKKEIKKFLSQWKEIISDLQGKRGKARHFREVCFSNYDISKLAKELQWLRCQKKLFTFLNPCEDLCHTSKKPLDTTMDDLELNKRTMRSKRVCAPTPPSQRLRKRAVYDEGSLMDLQHGASIEEDEHNRQSDKENRGEDPASQPGLPTTLRHRFGDGHYDKTGLLGPVLTSHALRFLPGSPSSPSPVRKFTAGSPLPLRERTIDSSLNSPIFFFADLSPKTRAGMTRPKASRESSLESEDFQAEKNRLYDMEVASKSSPFMAI